jgi:hypothetical protein
MHGKKMLVTTMVLVLAFTSIAEGKKKKQAPRGIVESMQSMPCGVKERGLTGLGSIFGSVGVQHVNSNEKLCQQYLFRTDELDYQIRPLDTKHSVILPVGHEGEFKIKKDRLFLKVPDEDKKTRAYQVVAVEPVKSSGLENTGYRPAYRPTEPRPTDPTAERVANQRSNPPPPPQ